MLTGKGVVLSAALAATSPAKVHQVLEEARANAHCLTAAGVEAGLELWRQWAADAGVTVSDLAPVLARVVGCSTETVSKALATV